MRSYITAAGVLALAATANAANCNPSYNVPSAGSCIESCNSNAAKSFDGSWTNDPTSDHFIASLALMCDKVKSGSLYTAFMSSAGMCMTACSTDEQNAFFTQYSGACAWYTAHSSDTCADTATTTAAAATTTTAAAADSTTAAAATTTTAAAAVTTTASTSAVATNASNNTTAASSPASNSTVLPSGAAANSSNATGNTTTPVSNNNGSSSSASAAGKLEYGAITAVAVAFAAFIAL